MYTMNFQTLKVIHNCTYWILRFTRKHLVSEWMNWDYHAKANVVWWGFSRNRCLLKISITNSPISISNMILGFFWTFTKNVKWWDSSLKRMLASWTWWWIELNSNAGNWSTAQNHYVTLKMKTVLIMWDHGRHKRGSDKAIPLANSLPLGWYLEHIDEVVRLNSNKQKPKQKTINLVLTRIIQIPCVSAKVRHR